MMFRNQTRRGIRAVQAGHDPVGLFRESGVVIPTYCNDTVVRMPPDADPAMDRQRMREAARLVADGYLKDPPLLALNALPELAPAKPSSARNPKFGDDPRARESVFLSSS